MAAYTSSFGSVGSTPHVDLDFINAAYWSASGNQPSALKCIRNSVGYIDNTAGIWTAVPANMLRQSNKGLLNEEGRTNFIRNNSMQGAVAGSPGALPTNWSVVNPTGLTRTISIGTLNGIDFINISWTGTASSTGVIQVNFDTPTGIPPSSSGVATPITTLPYALSSWVSTSSSIGVSALNLILQSIDISATVIATTKSVDIHTVTAFTRQSLLTTPAFNWEHYLRPAIQTNSITSGTVVNLSVRIGWPQLELPEIAIGGLSWKAHGSNIPVPWVSSPIRTTGSYTTRYADTVYVANSPPFTFTFSIVAQAVPTTPITYDIDQYLVSISDFNSDSIYASTVQFSLTRRFQTGLPQYINGSTRTNVGSVVWANGGTGRFGGSMSPNAQAGNFNGGTTTATTASTTTFPLGSINPMVIYIGSSGIGDYAVHFNGYLTRVTLWSQVRLDDAAVINLTAGKFFPEFGFVQKQNQLSFIQAAISPETAVLSPGIGVVTLRAPHPMTVTGVTASLSTEGSSATTINIKINGTTIFVSNLQIDASSRTNVGSVAPASIAANTIIQEDDEITYDIVSAGISAVGLKVTIKGIYL